MEDWDHDKQKVWVLVGAAQVKEKALIRADTGQSEE